ncbi:hypothetical protein [Saccharopolyspora sp. 5N708]|uniref:hypothetical protein n=1 Tax=Saccharopolyspora sp. 5N708 TaxID=3457424 RepID=UPI003FD5B7DD
MSQNKWDYQFNAHLQNTVDITCLAQLVQAVVLHEQIGLSPNLLDSWYPAENGSTHVDLDPCEIPEELDGLANIVKILDNNEQRSKYLLVESAARATDDANSDSFCSYLQLLENEAALGTFLGISNSYFGTGFSDRDLFKDLDAHDYSGLARAHADQAAKLKPKTKDLLTGPFTVSGLYKKCQQMKRDNREANAHLALAASYNDIFKKIRHWEECASLEEGPFAKLEPANDPSYYYSKKYAAVDVVKNAAATYYYCDLANLHSASYMPHPLRAALAVFDGIVDPSSGGVFEWGETPVMSRTQLEQVMNYLRYTRLSKLRPGNILDTDKTAQLDTRQYYFDAPIPLMLSVILEEATSPADLIEKAIILRESKAATKLRKWFGELEECAHQRRLSSRDLERRQNALRDALQRWFEDFSAGHEITFGVNAGIVSLQQRFRLPECDWPISRSFRLRLIYDVASVGLATYRLAPLLSRVFGNDLARSWTIAQDTFNRINPQSTITLLEVPKNDQNLRHT